MTLPSIGLLLVALLLVLVATLGRPERARGAKGTGLGPSVAGWWQTAREMLGAGGPLGGAPAGAPPGARWARRADLGPLLGAGAPGRMTLGVVLGAQGRPSGCSLATEVAQSVAIIGPTQSGKTTCLAVPAILGWRGPVLAASVKTDLLRDTVSWRRRCGRVWCVDPSQVTGLPPDTWSPLRVAATWNGARRIAADMTESGRSGATTPDGEFWYSMAAKLLAPLLFAASVGGRSMADVLRWVDTQEVGEVMELLEGSDSTEALQAARANWLREERQRSSVYTTAESVLEPFADVAPRDRSVVGAPAPDVDPEALLEGEHTLYVCAPAHDQRRLVGLFTAVVKDVVQTAFTRSARLGRPIDPPLLVVLDEAANIAPLAELDGLAATCAGHGVQLVTVWQDLAQISARYGVRSATVVNNHRAKIFLAGISDPATLDHASQLIGEEHRLVPSITRDPAGGRAVTMAPAPRPLLPGDALRRMPPRSGVLVYGSLPPVRLGLRPWWRDPDLRGVGGTPEGPAGNSP